MATPRTEWRFPQDAPAYPVTVGCTFEMAEGAKIPEAIAKIEQAMTPATVEQCEGWLVMLQAATAHRQESDATCAAAYTLYASELRQWPADVARQACQRLARGKPGQTGTNWFPTLAELVAECERLAVPRRVLLSALQRYQPPALPHVNDRRYGAPSEADAAAVHRMAEEARVHLRQAADRAKPKPPGGGNSSIAGKPDETGITPAMREILARQRGEL